MRRDVAFGEMSPEGRAQLAEAIRRGIEAAKARAAQLSALLSAVESREAKS